MSLDKNTVRKALEGVVLIQNPVLWETSGQPTEEHGLAIKSVQNDLDAFRKIVIDELMNYPDAFSFFGNIIRARISQDYPLDSPFIQKLFSSGMAELENRLHRIIAVKNIHDISKNVGATKSITTGYETDDIIEDIWAELFVADFLFSRLRVKYIEKIKAEKSQPNIEFYIQHRKKEWIVEVTRLRRRDFQGETMPWGSINCTKRENISEIQKALRMKLFDKNKQIHNYVKHVGREYNKKIVAIKTSQEEYQDCAKVIVREARRLMRVREYPEISHLLLIYDIEKYELVKNIQTRRTSKHKFDTTIKQSIHNR